MDNIKGRGNEIDGSDRNGVWKMTKFSRTSDWLGLLLKSWIRNGISGKR